jgi:hypothetical protein
MPTGLFKTPDQSAQVEYDGVSCRGAGWTARMRLRSLFMA